MGTIGGFAAWFSLAFKSAFALVGIGVFAILLNPGLSTMQIKLIAVLFCIIFAIIIVQTGSYYGFNVKGGSEAVGRYTTAAVVTSIFLVILADSILGLIFY